jgi:hypothetical protein
MLNFEALLSHPFSAIFMKPISATIPKSNSGHEKRSPPIFFSWSICVHGLPAGPNTPLSAFRSDHQSALRSIKPTQVQLRRQIICDASLFFGSILGLELPTLFGHMGGCCHSQRGPRRPEGMAEAHLGTPSKTNPHV